MESVSVISEVLLNQIRSNGDDLRYIGVTPVVGDEDLCYRT